MPANLIVRLVSHGADLISLSLQGGLSVEPVVSLQDLSHEYVTYEKTAGFWGTMKDFFGRKAQSQVALGGISLTVNQGEMIGLLGPNGAGKTTLMKVLSGLVCPTRGAVQVLGDNPHRKSPRFLRQIGLVLGQKSQLMWDLPPSDTLLLLKEIYGVSDRDYRDRLTFLLDSLNVAHRLDTPVRKLSLGERMKFELIAALLHQPKLLMLDEPTIGLDIASQRAIHAFLRSVNSRLQTTVILTSHYARDVEALADRLVILRKGHVYYNGAIGDLLSSNRDVKVLTVESTSDLKSHPLGFRHTGENRWQCEVLPHDLNRALMAVAADVTIQNVTTQDKPLEDILYAMFSVELDDDEVGEDEDDD